MTDLDKLSFYFSRSRMGQSIALACVNNLADQAKLSVLLSYSMSVVDARECAAIIVAGVTEANRDALTQLLARSMGPQTAQAVVQELMGDDGGGANDYHADAVHFDSASEAHLFLAAMSAPDSPRFLFSEWINFQNADLDPSFFAGFNPGEPGSPAPKVAIGIVGFFENFDIGLRFFANAQDEALQTLNVQIVSGPGIFVPGAWYHICGSADTGHGPGEKLVKLVVNRASVGRVGSIEGDDIHPSFNIGFNGAPFGVPYQDDGYQFDAATEGTSDVEMADFQVWAGVYADVTDPAVLAKFITADYRPVDPAVAAAEFGQQTILLTGGADTFGTNQGTDGAFVLTGSLTNSVLGPVVASAAPVPANNDFANATAITLGQTLAGSNVWATKETGEPDHASNAGGGSVWWKFVAPSSADVNVSLAGSAFDTVLGVYTGVAVNSLVTIASNDDFGGRQSALTFTPVEGTTYYIAVDGYDNVGGSITITVTAA